jgi:hypothetical protein
MTQETEANLRERRLVRGGKVDQLLDIRIALADEVIIATEAIIGAKPNDMKRLGGKVQGLHVSIGHIDEALRGIT